jgi:hypothetical protein
VSTKDSPPALIHAQAVRVAHEMKKMPLRSNGKDTFKVGIAMDDKILTVELPWDDLEKLTEAELVPVICSLMREEPRPEVRKGVLH